MKLFLRGLCVIASLILFWHCLVSVFQLPPYILPTPLQVLKTISLQFHLIMTETVPTVIETVLGLFLGVLIGCIAAISMTFFRPISWWLLPILIISQAIPTFAIAPLLVVWFGYGIASKIITTIIMLFFPITSAFYDGLCNTKHEWLYLAKTMHAKKWRIFWHIRIPAAMPNLASGIRVATVIAPIGAVIGEWVGASRGLGFLMLNANARMQIDLMFAALIAIILLSLILYFIVNKLLTHLIFWETA